MRVLALTGTPDLPEQYLLLALPQQGVNLRILCERPAAFSAAGIDAEEVKFRSRFDLTAIREIRSQISSFKPDIVHSFSARALTAALFASGRFNVKHVAYRGTIGRLHRWDPLSRIGFLSPRVDKIICVSNAVQNYLHTMGVPQKRLVTIYKGHDPAWYEGLPLADRKTLGIPNDGIVVAFLGNVRPVKGVVDLLAAFEKVDPRLNIRLLIVGEIRDRRISELIQRSAVKERIHLTGFQAQGAGYLKIADLMVMPSKEREGFPKAVLEGMIQGVPPIVTAVGGMPELVENNLTGLVVPPNSPSKLADAISSLASSPDLRSRLGDAAREKILNQFTHCRTVRQTVELYSSLVS